MSRRGRQPSRTASTAPLGTGTDRAEPAIPTVIYIAGSGRSGSTLLERVLGGMPGAVNVGELIDLFRRTAPRGERCGCGLAFADCPFWTGVGKRAFDGWEGQPAGGDPPAAEPRRPAAPPAAAARHAARRPCLPRRRGRLRRELPGALPGHRRPGRRRLRDRREQVAGPGARAGPRRNRHTGDTPRPGRPRGGSFAQQAGRGPAARGAGDRPHAAQGPRRGRRPVAGHPDRGRVAAPLRPACHPDALRGLRPRAAIRRQRGPD